MNTLDAHSSADRRDWASLMRTGDFARAWQIADEDLRSGNLTSIPKHQGPRHLQRIWRGEPLRDKRVLVRCYHGLGDTIQFCRFLKPLRAIAREVILWCQPPLIPLLGSVQGVDRIIPLHDHTPEVDFDVDIEIMEIAHALKVGLQQIRVDFPYLTAPSGSCTKPRPARQVLSVGLIWQAGEWDGRRSIPAETLRVLHRVSGIRLYSLQHGPAQKSAVAIPAEHISTTGISELAARLMELDLLLTVDSMPAHLAGALAREVWTMLHADCDWRWPREDPETPWYPTMRLFHQRREGDWRDLIDAIAGTLAERVRLQAAEKYEGNGLEEPRSC